MLDCSEFGNFVINPYVVKSLNTFQQYELDTQERLAYSYQGMKKLYNSAIEEVSLPYSLVEG